MKIKTLHVRNFTSLIDVELRELPGLAVFIGKNSSGKSNIIDAMSLLFLEFGPDMERELGAIDEFQHLFPAHDAYVDAPSTISATLSLTEDEWGQLFGNDELFQLDYSPEVYIEKGFHLAGTSITWVIDSLRFDGIDYIRNGEEVYSQIDSALLVESNISVSVTIADLVQRLSDLLRYSLTVVQTSESRPDWSDRFRERPTIVDDEQAQELWISSQSKGLKRRPWTKLGQQFERFTPNGHRLVGVDSSIQVEEGDVTVSLGMTGEGTQNTLKLVDQIESSGPLIVIEEPETHLHPGLIKQVGQYLTEIAESGKQLFIATHSPFLVEYSPLKGLYSVSKPSTETKVKRLDDIAGLQHTLFGIGMRPSDILFCDAILLVEGLSDNLFYSRISDLIGASLAERHVKVISANGYPRGRRKIEFWAEVGREAGLPLFLILDKDAEVEAQEAIDKGHVVPENCQILARGTLEDHYPVDTLQKAVETLYDVELNSDDLVSNSSVESTIRKLVGRKAAKNSWKPELAEEMASRLSVDEAESGLREIVDFLRRMHRELGGGLSQ